MLSEVDVRTANMRIQGMTLEEIGNREGKDMSTISKRLSKAEVAEYVDRQKELLVTTSLKRSVENLNYAVDSYQAEGSDTQLREHGWKTSIRVAEAAGILPSNSNTVNITGNVVITQNIQNILSKFSDSLKLPDSVEDANYVATQQEI